MALEIKCRFIYHGSGPTQRRRRNPARRLVYATTHESFVTAVDPLFNPLFLDHRSQWQALVDLHPTSPFARSPPADYHCAGPAARTLVTTPLYK